MSDQSLEKQQRGVQSVEIASEVLEALAGFEKPVSLKELAAAVGMTSARVFPYLVSLVRSGLIHKDEKTGFFEPGALSQELGLIGLHYLNPVDLADAVIRELSRSTGHVVLLSVWGSMGPTVIRMDEARYSLNSEIRLGSMGSLVNTSLGQVFAAWMPRKIVEEALAYESLRLAGHDLTVAENQAFLEGLDKVRARGVVALEKTVTPGMSTMSAPVFGMSGEIVFALTLVDESTMIDLSLDGQTVSKLKSCAHDLSARLGFVDN